jgi:hypothetical protein
MEEELMEVKDNVVLPMQMWELYKGSDHSPPHFSFLLIHIHLSIHLSIYYSACVFNKICMLLCTLREDYALKMVIMVMMVMVLFGNLIWLP